MKLDHLYSLRNNFTVIGLTGRTGSGCTLIAETLSKNFEYFEKAGLRNEKGFTDPVFLRKYTICKDFLKYGNNWVPFEVIRYSSVLLFYILNKYGGDYKSMHKLLFKYYKEDKKDSNSSDLVRKLMASMEKINEEYSTTIIGIKSFKCIEEIKSPEDLQRLNDIFFGEEFSGLKKKIFELLEKNGYFRTRLMLHWVSCNIRSNGDPLDEETTSIDSIYSLAVLINKLIKARKEHNGTKPTKIVIDSLRNSLEIMFFKERYSAFYMVATKDVLGNARKRLEYRLKYKISNRSEREKMVDKLLGLDETEYKTNDFSKGTFSSPDVENCIQKGDYHVFNLRKDQIDEFSNNPNAFLTREEQLMKLIALIKQPGIITPSSSERCMQVANTAKLNSGCISRKVGAVITDCDYYIKAVGWNDVGKGHTPCNLRSVTDFFIKPKKLYKNLHYSEFEKGNVSPLSSYKYKDDTPGNFKDALIDFFQEAYTSKASDLNGKNCSFCFKSIHNHYEGEANQVHTRSLHAEENAMLQITKLGGNGVKDGILFTTASPCELCSKKAYQLGIRKIYYIDPYPGISVDQILKGGNNKPMLIPFSGAIGTVYHKLYEPFLSYKDEISMTLEHKPKRNLAKEFTNLLNKSDDPEIKAFLLKKKKMTDQEVTDLLKRIIES